MSRPFHTLPRLFVHADLAAKAPVEIPPEQGHYLLHVLRMRQGESLRLFNGRDGEWRAEIAASVPTGKKALTTLIPSANIKPQAPEISIHLLCSIIKKAHFDDIIMKATELGVTHIQPILTERTQIREMNLERARAIAIEAAEQSERLSIPTFSEPSPLAALAQNWPFQAPVIVCAEWGEALPIARALDTLPSGPSGPSGPAVVITGPEGGFTAEELILLKGLPRAIAARLGPRILRADTAALAALTCWQALRGDWR